MVDVGLPYDNSGPVFVVAKQTSSLNRLKLLKWWSSPRTECFIPMHWLWCCTF